MGNVQRDSPYVAGVKDPRYFFQRVLPYNRRKAAIEAQRNARAGEVAYRRAFHEDMASLDNILEGYNQEEDMQENVEGWLGLQEIEEFGLRESGFKRKKPDTLDDEAFVRAELLSWLDDVTQPEYLGYRPSVFGAGSHDYMGASVSEGVNIPGINMPGIEEDFGGIEMVEVELDEGPFRPVVDVSVPKPDGEGEDVFAVNPFSVEELNKILENTRENPFKRPKKKGVY